MKRWLVRIVYWLAVLAISLTLVAALITFFESRDGSQIESGGTILLPLLSFP